MKDSTRQFFLELNMYLFNGYGMSELSGAQLISNPKSWKSFDPQYLQEVGESIPGVDLLIANPDKDGNGEMCLRGKEFLNCRTTCLYGVL